MGKALVVSSGGKGFYTLKEMYDNSKGAETYFQLTKENIVLENSKLAVGQEFDIFAAHLAALIVSLSEAISSGENTSALIESMNETIKILADIARQLNVIQTNLNANIIALTGVEEDPIVYRTRMGWSADYNEGIPDGTIVGTIDRKRTDIPEKFDIVIQPTFRDGSENGYLWDAARDGIMLLKEGSPSTGWAWNYAMADGADTWKPRYIYAYVQTINFEENTGTVTVDTLNSILPYGVPKNQPLPIVFEYMNCGAIAFSKTNSVVVDVSVAGNYKVVGFQTNPFKCNISLLFAPYWQYTDPPNKIGHNAFYDGIKIIDGAHRTYYNPGLIDGLHPISSFVYEFYTGWDFYAICREISPTVVKRINVYSASRQPDIRTGVTVAEAFHTNGKVVSEYIYHDWQRPLFPVIAHDGSIITHRADFVQLGKVVYNGANNTSFEDKGNFSQQVKVDMRVGMLETVLFGDVEYKIGKLVYVQGYPYFEAMEIEE